MPLGKRIGEARRNKNLTQEDLAEKLGVTRQTISNWELDKAEPSLDMLKELSNLLEIDIFDTQPNLNHKRTVIDSRFAYTVYLLQLILTIFYIGYLVFKGRVGSNISIPVILLISSTIVYLSFEYALKNNDYTMIAGYNRGGKYDRNIARTVVSIELNILIQGLIATNIYVIGEIFASQEVMMVLIPIILFVYTINIILIPLYNKHKNSPNLYKNEGSPKPIKWYSIIFLLEILSLIMSTIICFVKYNIENNTVPAIKIGGSVLVLTGLSTANFFIEQGRYVNAVEAKSKYKLGLISYLVILINILGILFVFHMGASAY